ncbi:g11552 [Coccomyxa viridis]|uniref:G11552 protein n=1 Tax=Coccomyxa viridis TaxID=1274662 RepID=A0ABP1GAX2_9CHLO
MQDPNGTERVATQLHQACRDVGFFYIQGHGMSGSVSNGVRQEARRWFNMPAHVKEQIALNPHTAFRGYQQLGANVTRYDGGFQRDWHEAIDLYKEEADASASPVHGQNQWPSHSPAFEAVLRQYISGCLSIGQAVMRGIAQGLGLQDDFFESKAGGLTNAESSYWVTRVIHYPPLQEGKQESGGAAVKGSSEAAAGGEIDRAVQLSCGEHTDYGLLTIVNQDPDIPALQVKNARGEWITAAPIPGTFVCNIGDMMRVYTNGAYTPTLHRVVNADPSRSRVSVPFFYETAFDAEVAPVAALLKDNKQPMFNPVIYGRHLESKVLSNFELGGSAAAAAV